jgi:putative NADH-flavin reductase
MNKMKTKKIGLDIDFLGGLGSLTVEEEKALSDFFRLRKLQQSKSISKTKKLRPLKHTKSLA